MHRQARAQPHVAFPYTELNTGRDARSFMRRSSHETFGGSTPEAVLEQAGGDNRKADQLVAVKEAVGLQEAKQQHELNTIRCRMIRQQIADS